MVPGAKKHRNRSVYNTPRGIARNVMKNVTRFSSFLTPVRRPHFPHYMHIICTLLLRHFSDTSVDVAWTNRI